MAVGLSLLSASELPYNFNSPYKARNIIDFWRRWHMTLSGGFFATTVRPRSAAIDLGIGRRYLNLIVTMSSAAFGAGTSWTFVVWGGLHGII